MTTVTSTSSRTGTPTVLVREAQPAEYPTLADLLGAAFTATFEVTDWYRENLRRVAEHALDHEWWVAAEPDGRLLGAVKTPRWAGPGVEDAPREFTFGLLGVDPAVRGRSVGRALVRHAVDVARERGFDAVAIWSGPQMTSAHRLYLSEGFVRVPERETLVVDGGQRLLSFVLPLVDGGLRRPPVATPVDVETYGPPVAEAGGPSFVGRVDPGQVAPSRYHLYVDWTVPAARHVALVRALRGLEDAVPVWVLDPARDGRGPAFREGPGLTRDGGGQGFALLREAYARTAGGRWDGPVRVPVLWDAVEGQVVSDDPRTIVDDLVTGFGELALGDGVAPSREAGAAASEPAAAVAASGGLAAWAGLAGVEGLVAWGGLAGVAGLAASGGLARLEGLAASGALVAAEALAPFEAALAGGGPYLAGARLTVADTALWALVTAPDPATDGLVLRPSVDLGAHPHLAGWAARLADLPELARPTLRDTERRYPGRV